MSFTHHIAKASKWRALVALIVLIAATIAQSASAQDFFDKGPATQFISFDVHGLMGTSTITQNYESKFDEISSYSQHPGLSVGAGVGATLGFKNWLGLTTEFNLVANNSSATVMIAGKGDNPYAAMTIRNRYYVIDVPTYIKVSFNLSQDIRWNLIGGVYYSLGYAGCQKQNIYSSYLNDLGQLININQQIKPDYYHSKNGFINSSMRSDIGVIFGSGFDLGTRITVGFRGEFGLKNVAYIPESSIDKPNIHNLAFRGSVGWRF